MAQIFGKDVREVAALVNGATFVGVDTLTEVKLKGGKGNPYRGRLKKRMKGARAMAFQNKNTNGYRAMVERRLAAEGKDPSDFQLQPRAWGTRVPNLPLVEHGGELYFELIFQGGGTVTYELDGREVDPTEIQGFEVRKEREGSQGGLEDKVIIRTFKVASLTALRIGGDEYVGMVQ